MCRLSCGNSTTRKANQDCKIKHNIMCDNSIINCKAILNVDGSLSACGTGYNDTSDGFVLDVQ